MLGHRPMTVSNQKGVSALFVLIFLAMFAFALLSGFKLYPVYFDHWAVVSTADSFGEDPELAQLSEREYKKRFNLRLQTNNIRDFDFDESIEVDMQEDFLLLNIDYEKRVNIYKNIDAVVSFKEELEYRY